MKFSNTMRRIASHVLEDNLKQRGVSPGSTSARSVIENSIRACEQSGGQSGISVASLLRCLRLACDEIDGVPVHKPHPLRVQRSRRKGYKLPEGTVVVTRGTKWGNPFDSADAFEQWLLHGTIPDRQQLVEELSDGMIRMRRHAILESLDELKGKQLACFCTLDTKCHADVLAKLANKSARVK